MVNRRRFLQISTLAASGGVAGCAAPDRQLARTRVQTPARLGPGAPRRIIHVVSDGMSLGTLSCADQWARHLRGRGTAWLGLWNHPEARTGLMDMRSLDSLVTDSAAASSSWGSGARVRNGVLNVSSKDRSLVPLMDLFGQAGWRRGLVTTTEITHATPAGFTVSINDRGKGEQIAELYLKARLDVYLGGAQNHFDPAKRKDTRNLWSEFAGAGYYVARTRAELRKAPLNAPWLGTFAPGHLPYTIDSRASKALSEEVPTIAEMTARALERLAPYDQFLLQVEGGRVDHACHNNDAAAALQDQIALDDAIDLILQFQRNHPETLVVITTDHGNANLGLNGMGSAYRDSSRTFQHISEVRCSFPEILKQLKDAKSDKESAEILAETTGFKVNKRKLATFLPFVKGKGRTLFDQMNSDVAALGQLLANHLGIGFVGTTHTSDYVPIAAIGPGADRFRGTLLNTDVFRHYTDLAGIDYRNPQEHLIAQAVAPRQVEDIAAYALG
jgi:alkaline phosphatase